MIFREMSRKIKTTSRVAAKEAKKRKDQHEDSDEALVDGEDEVYVNPSRKARKVSIGVGFRRRSGHVADGHLSCLARWSHVHLILAVHKRFVAVFVLVFALFGLLGGDPRRGLDLLGYFSEDHGKTSRSSHTSKEVWSTRATKHIGKEYLGNTREESRAGERERGAGIPR